MRELEKEIRQDAENPYPGLSLLVYDAADFYPRGSLHDTSKVKPPYILSRTPSFLNTIQKVIDATLAANPDCGIERPIRSMCRDGGSSDNDKNITKRKLPEEINRRLNLNDLRLIFSGSRKGPTNDFVRGDKIAIIRPKTNYEFLVVVDISRGDFTAVYEPDEPKDNIIDDYLTEKIAVSENVTPFEEEDLGNTLRAAKDIGKRKDYPPETQKFFDAMRRADVDVEYELIEHIGNVVLVSETVHRVERRLGRETARMMLMALRTGNLSNSDDILQEVKSDIESASLLISNPIEISISDIKSSFESLFKAERYYMEAILNFPWNNVGPEPFDALIEVFWFRFNFETLRHEWSNRDLHMRELKSEFYRLAQKQRIMAWARKAYENIDVSSLKGLKEEGITYTMSEVEEIAGPISNYFDEKEFREESAKEHEQNRPSGLTLLLWRTLKWASASEWKNARTMYFSDMRHLDPELWDEKVADPFWQDIGDFQGRLVLPGESMHKPISHLQSDRGSKLGQLEKAISYEIESNGGEASLADVVQEKQRRLRNPKQPKSFESIAGGFSGAVSKFGRAEILARISRLSDRYKLIALHRLGYDAPYGYKDGYVSHFKTVAYIINLCFDGNSARYYNAVKEITKALLE